MAEEYVNKERLIKDIERSFGEISTPFVVRKIRDFPAADVAPKSEVAREIFEEIENVIDNELQNNHKVLPQFEFSNELWNKMSGRIEALKEICDFIAELKKKYTEVEG